MFTRRSKTQFLLLLLSTAFFGLPLRAVPGRIVSVATGFGLPNLLTLEGAVVAWPPHVQIGFGYGLIPGLTSFGIPVSSQTTTLADGNTYRYTPTVSGNLAMWSPFVRWFPTERNTYLELNYALLRLSMPFTADVSEVNTGTTIKDTLEGSILLTQHLPTLSMGHIFSGQVYFINVRMGFMFIYNTTVNASVKLNNAALFGGAEANKTAIEEANQTIQANLDQAIAQSRGRFYIIPSFALTFGLNL